VNDGNTGPSVWSIQSEFATVSCTLGSAPISDACRAALSLLSAWALRVPSFSVWGIACCVEPAAPLYNAARYAKREVHLAFTVQDGLNQLLVDDDGPGIPEKDRQRAFDSFVQLEPTATHKTGFGLGLAIVKRSIEWHGGDVVIAQSPLGGARISAVWPVTLPD
jgi:hypothetical protein